MNADFRTPQKKVSGYGSNRSGLSHWVQQKFTAIINLLCSLWFVNALIFNNLSSYSVALKFFQHPVNAAFAGLTVCSVFYHAKLGLTMVCEDYISSKCKLIFALLVVNIFCYGGIALCVFSLVRVL